MNDKNYKKNTLDIWCSLTKGKILQKNQVECVRRSDSVVGSVVNIDVAVDVITYIEPGLCCLLFILVLAVTVHK